MWERISARGRAARRPQGPDGELVAPQGLVAAVTMDGDLELAVLEWPVATEAAPACLTEAEREVTGCVLEGMSNAEIARRRGTAPRTVANQLASIFAKLGVGSRHELVAHLVRERAGSA